MKDSLNSTARQQAGMIADATMTANHTFGRDTITALNGSWHADTEYAELRFTRHGQDYWLVQDAPWPAARWYVAHVATLAQRVFTVPPGMPITEAADPLQGALEALQRQVNEVPR